MSIDNAQKFRDAFAALFAPDMNATALALADSMLQQELSYSRSQPVDAAASTAGNPAKLLRWAANWSGPNPNARSRASVRASESGPVEVLAIGYDQFGELLNQSEVTRETLHHYADRREAENVQRREVKV